MKRFDPTSFTNCDLATRLRISYGAARQFLVELVDHDLAEPILSFCGRRNRFRLTPLRNINRKYREVVADSDLDATPVRARNPEKERIL
jgi:hypothetical protein